MIFGRDNRTRAHAPQEGAVSRGDVRHLFQKARDAGRRADDGYFACGEDIRALRLKSELSDLRAG